MIFPTHRQAPLSPAAVKASAGAVEHLLLAPVDDLAGALADLHIAGLRVVGAEADAPLTVREADLRGPIALVVGSEGQGLGPAVRRRCDLMVRIPMRGVIGSLNASVAGSILLFEATTQRGELRETRRPSGRSHAPPVPAVHPAGRRSRRRPWRAVAEADCGGVGDRACRSSGQSVSRQGAKVARHREAPSRPRPRHRRSEAKRATKARRRPGEGRAEPGRRARRPRQGESSAKQ